MSEKWEIIDIGTQKATYDAARKRLPTADLGLLFSVFNHNSEHPDDCERPVEYEFRITIERREV